MANSVVHFEIYCDDVERAKKFYAEVLGWTFKDLGDDMGGYVLVYPSGDNTENRAKNGINGGMARRRKSSAGIGNTTPNAFVCTVTVKDIEETIRKVEPAGGRIDMPIGDVPGVGRLAYIRDTEMNLVGIMQPADQDR